MTGRFVAFEGGEGGGKSTQLRRLGEWLRAHGRAVTTTFEPGGTPVGTTIRGLLLDADRTVTPRAEALLFAADRAHHVATLVRPALDAGEIVLTDRYVDSSLAYQSAGRDLDREEIRRLSTWATDGLLPDLTIVLDLDPAVGLRRARGAEGGDRLEAESLEFHNRVRAAFLDFARAEPARYAVIDAGGRPGAVAAAILAAVRERLPELTMDPEPQTQPTPTEARSQ